MLNPNGKKNEAGIVEKEAGIVISTYHMIAFRGNRNE
jgi:hypothetical protein